MGNCVYRNVVYCEMLCFDLLGHRIREKNATFHKTQQYIRERQETEGPVYFFFS